MKNIASLLVVILILSIAPANSYAAEREHSFVSLIDDQDYSDISSLESEILADLTEIYGNSLPADFPELVNFSSAFKVYVDTNIQNLGSADKEEIFNLMNNSTYVWVIPFVISGENVQVTLAKGLPLNSEIAYLLTNEEKQQIENLEGKWTVSEIAVGVVDSYIDQISANPSVANIYDDVIFIGGVPGLSLPMALAFKGGYAASWISLGYPYPILDKTIMAQRSIGSNIYDFNSIISTSQEYQKTTSDNLVGGFGSNRQLNHNSFSYIIGGFCTLLFVTSTFCIVRKCKHKK